MTPKVSIGTIVQVIPQGGDVYILELLGHHLEGRDHPREWAMVETDNPPQPRRDKVAWNRERIWSTALDLDLEWMPAENPSQIHNGDKLVPRKLIY